MLDASEYSGIGLAQGNAGGVGDARIVPDSVQAVLPAPTFHLLP